MKRILITGATGMVGRSLQRMWGHKPHIYYAGITGKRYDLTSHKETAELFAEINPHIVVHLAARVGGVRANERYVGNFFYENNLINTNVLHTAAIYGSKVVSMLSTCIYPDNVQYPITEDQLHNGEPHPSNFGYAYAKRMLEVQSRAYNQQYNTSFFCLIPNNMYGPDDNFDLESGHFIPATIRKIHIAQQNNEKFIECWGDGSPLRQCTYVDDMARVIDWSLSLDSFTPMNVGNTEEKPIKEIVEMIADCMAFDGEIRWDTTKPIGQHRKPMDTSYMKSLGFYQFISIKEGIKKTCEWYKGKYGILH